MSGPRPGVRFFKVCGAGNDFILIDARQPLVGLEPSRWARVLCRRGLGVGADGLLLVEPSEAAAVRCTYFNADGSRAFCGNGTLCVARWAHEVAGHPADLQVETDAGIIPARVRGNRVEMEVSSPRELRRGVDLAPANLAGEGSFVDLGCPHLVVIGECLPDDRAFAAQAPALRRHPALGEAGANVDFVVVETPHRIRLRIFERGVEGETLASGTGCLAAALAAAERGLAASPIACLTSGGETLEVRFRHDGAAFEDIRLDGSARLVYEGKLGPHLANP